MPETVPKTAGGTPYRFIEDHVIIWQADMAGPIAVRVSCLREIAAAHELHALQRMVEIRRRQHGPGGAP